MGSADTLPPGTVASAQPDEQADWNQVADLLDSALSTGLRNIVSASASAAKAKTKAGAASLLKDVRQERRDRPVSEAFWSAARKKAKRGSGMWNDAVAEARVRLGTREGKPTVGTSLHEVAKRVLQEKRRESGLS